MGDLNLFIDESANDPGSALVESLLSRASAKPIVFTQGDSARRIVLHLLQQNPDSTGNPYIYSPAPDSLRLGVGGHDEAATGGTFTITDTAGAQTTAAIALAADASTIQTAIRAALTTNFSAATVTGTSISLGLVIDRVSTGALADITISTAAVTPQGCIAEIVNSDNGTGSLSEKWSVKIVRPMALKQDSFTQVTYDAPASASVTTGSTGVNAVHRFTWPAEAYAGSVSIAQALPTGTAKTITSNTVANPTVITSTAHGLVTGDQITILANNGSTPTIMGVHTVTRTSDDAFTIPINATVGGTGGTFYKLLTETVGPIPWNVGASALEDLFEEHGSTLAVDGNFTATKVGAGNYTVSYKGGLAGLPIPLGTVTSSLSTPVAFEGTLNCSNAGALNLLGTSTSVTTKLEIEKTVSGIPSTIAYNDRVVLRAELMGSGTWVADAALGTLVIALGKVFTVSNTLTLTGTDGSSVAFGAGGTVAYVANKLSVFAATTSAELAGVISDETGTGALVFANSPTLVTPALGTPASGVLTNCTGLPLTTGITGTLAVANGGTGRTTALARFTARGTGTQSMGAGTPTKANLGTAVENVGAYLDTTNHRWGPLPAGTYHIGCNIASDSGPWLINILKNGTDTQRLCYLQNSQAPGGAVDIISDGNDYFEFWVTNQSGGSLDMYSADATTTFWGHQLL